MNNETIIDIVFVIIAISLISLVIYAFIKQLKKMFIFVLICIILYFGYLFLNKDISFLSDVRHYRIYIEDNWLLNWDEFIDMFNEKTDGE